MFSTSKVLLAALLSLALAGNALADPLLGHSGPSTLGVNQRGTTDDPYPTDVIRSITYVNHTTANATTITAPSEIEADDLLVMIDAAENTASTPTSVVPTGFTQIGSDLESGTTNMKLIASYKIADGTEDGATITGMSGSRQDGKIIMQFRGDRPIASFSVSTPVTQSVLGNPTAQTIAASSGTQPVLAIMAFFDCNSCASVNPRTDNSATEAVEISFSGGGHGYAHYVRQPVADFTFDMDDEGDGNFLFGFYLHNFAP